MLSSVVLVLIHFKPKRKIMQELFYIILLPQIIGKKNRLTLNYNVLYYYIEKTGL